MSVIRFYIKALRNFGNFHGRASLSEFWYFKLVFWVLSFCGALVCSVLAGAGALSVGTILLLGIAVSHVVPAWTVTVRRLHDSGRSGWWMLVMMPSCVPLSILIVLFMYFLFHGWVGLTIYAYFVRGMFVVTLGLMIPGIILLALPSNEGDNYYGPPPLTLRQL